MKNFTPLKQLSIGIPRMKILNVTLNNMQYLYINSFTDIHSKSLYMYI